MSDKSDKPDMPKTEPGTTRLGPTKRRLTEIRAWRGRMVVARGGEGLKRNDVLIGGDQDGPIVAFQHTLDDYDFLLRENDRLQKEVAAVNSARNKATNERQEAIGLKHFQSEATKLGMGLAKYREQHALDKKYILGLKAEIRRLMALLPAANLEVVGVRMKDTCPSCGCPDPAMDHAKFKAAASRLQLQLDKMRDAKQKLGLRYAKAVGQRRKLEAELKANG